MRFCGSPVRRARRGGIVFVRPDAARVLGLGQPSSAYRLLSDYGVGVPYIQAHIHGLSSRSVLNFGDSLTVLRDEEVELRGAMFTRA
jgi:hypothetical protein